MLFITYHASHIVRYTLHTTQYNHALHDEAGMPYSILCPMHVLMPEHLLI